MGAASFAAAQLLKELREEQGTSVQSKAIKAGLDPKHLKHIEIGQSDCSILIMKKLLSSYEMDWKDFFNEDYIDLYIMNLEKEDMADEN